MRWFGWALVASVGCSGSTIAPSDDGRDDPPQDTSPNLPPPPPANRNDAAFVGVVGVAVYDPGTGTFRGTTEGVADPEIPMGMQFAVIDSSREPDRTCFVVITPRGGSLEPAEWPEAAGAALGFELVPGETDIVDGCTDSILPNEFEGAIGDVLGKWNWGFAIDAIDETVQAEVEAASTASEWDAIKDLIAGATLYGNALPLSDIQSFTSVDGLARGYEVTEAFAIEVDLLDNRANIEADDIFIGGGDIRRGYYEFTFRRLFQGPFFLRDVPDPNAQTGDTSDTGGGMP